MTSLSRAYDFVGFDFEGVRRKDPLLSQVGRVKVPRGLSVTNKKEESSELPKHPPTFSANHIFLGSTFKDPMNLADIETVFGVTPGIASTDSQVSAVLHGFEQDKSDLGKPCATFSTEGDWIELNYVTPMIASFDQAEDGSYTRCTLTRDGNPSLKSKCQSLHQFHEI